MREFRLNGWQRIGIVLSISWAVVGGLWGRHITVAPYFDCMASAPSIPTQDFCRQHLRWVLDDWYTALLIALAPIPIAWLLIYIVVWTVRWIRRGFQQAI